MSVSIPPEIEQDTAEAEDAYKVSDLIFPPASFLYERDLVSFSVNNKLLKGWVKQPSPCCAAASVAGAWNALGGMDRSHPNALQYPDVIAIYCTILEEQIHRLTQSFERKLGAAPNSFQVLYRAVSGEIAKAVTTDLDAGQPPPKKERKISQAAVGKAMKAAIKDYKSSLPTTEIVDKGSPEDLASMVGMHPLLCMADIIATEVTGTKESSISYVAVPKPLAEGEEDNDLAAGEEFDDDEGEDDYPPEVPSVNTEPPHVPDANDNTSKHVKDDFACGTGIAAGTVLKKKSMKKQGSVETSSITWNWRFELAGIFNKLSGLKRLQHPTVPSTTIIGNWGILEGVIRLSEERGLGSSGLQATLLMGKKIRTKSKIEAPLSATDSDEKISQQWNVLRSAFQRDDGVLLFHLKNHYALIYALKEWVESCTEARSGIVNKRQVLTARRGQRPSAWIDFEEVRNQMIGWEGYKIMLISRGKETRPADIQNATKLGENFKADFVFNI